METTIKHTNTIFGIMLIPGIVLLVIFWPLAVIYFIGWLVAYDKERKKHGTYEQDKK